MLEYAFRCWACLAKWVCFTEVKPWHPRCPFCGGACEGKRR